MNASTPCRALFAGLLCVPAAFGQDAVFEPMDVFGLEYASDPQISPDGSSVVYVRTSMDVMRDQARLTLWHVGFGADGAPGVPRPLVGDGSNPSSPRWSPDGSRLAYVATVGESRQIRCRWMDDGSTATLTQLTEGASGLTWSPDGRWLAFSMFVPSEAESFAALPAKPEGATWAEAPKVIESLHYRYDGQGYTEPGHDQLFVLPAEGGTPRQLTDDPYDHSGRLAFTRDGKQLIFSANRDPAGDLRPLDSQLYTVCTELDDSDVVRLTSRFGPDESPALSPDGKLLAYVGFDDRMRGYENAQLWVLPISADGRPTGEPRSLTADLDRSVGSPRWRSDGKGLLVDFDDRGRGMLAFVGLDGQRSIVASDLGGLSLGRPYGGGQFSMARTGRVAYTRGTTARPADVAAFELNQGEGVRALTTLNEDLLGARRLGAVEAIEYASSFDERPIQGWIVYPPDFDPEQRYPLLLEIHGGPFANYGERFSAECQLYAAAGYVVLYTNPRGSTSYGEEFANLIHHAYPGNDYDDLMSGVDAVIARGFIDPEQLFVTGGSGGGVLTSWIVGKTDRFAAAVVAKPVIHWTSFALTADAYEFFYQYWFPGPPWEYQQQYWERSPLSLVGNVVTPTMLLTGEADYRTPISESEQYYQALKLQEVDTAMVRIPGASHGIASRPSRLIAKVAHVLAWFERYRPDTGEE